MSREIQLLATGMRTLVEDLGRAGYAHLGVPTAGAADRAVHRLAQRLVGNDESSAGLECLLGGLALRARCHTIVAVTGAPAAVTIDGSAVASARPHALAPGQVLEVGEPTHGLLVYVALAGGVDVAPALGSRSRDTLSGIGPDAVQPDQVLRLGEVDPASARSLQPDAWPLAAAAAPGEGLVRLDATWGPRDDWFTPAARETLASTTWTVRDDSDRVGTRLAGPALERVDGGAGELASEGMVRGAVQVTRAGLPVVFGVDHPTTGGYPVVAVLDPRSCDRLAQCRPGDQVVIRPRTLPGSRAPVKQAGLK
ncbi:biotin-dependent carboxyltransferase family protein [Arsenicicoccus piscis]|uniref:Allophanate hydrolase n=1 Tax=Arsenicicoccus piscis TaxID=673954 RepID=A0ABQ6HP84_9MICO|nr:biotin-dependent carboxyltransferase family protein [Arsenicicoccus piscis]MCH8628796.1 biotin-dependent carboxyltransferase family protein [Arsenicicoccus piscis]GMA20157.1 allophanate hydrolase [Arsenicicoccus piscis]